ncbi:MAG: hypothetical protein V3T30_08850 [Thermodesulfobacteriota bacterium]
MDEAIKDFEGNAIVVGGSDNNFLTVRKALFITLSGGKGAGEDSFKCFELGLKLKSMKDIEELNQCGTEDKAFLLEKVKEFEGWTTYIQGFLISILR